jgi:hypothetical protein
MPRPRAATAWKSENWTPTGPLRLKFLRFAGLFRSKSPF